MVDYLVIGHLTADLQADGSVRTGGTALYAALTAHRLGASVAILTTAASDLDLTALPAEISITVLPSPVSTTFHNQYHEGGRTQYMYRRAAPLSSAALELAPAARVIHLGPVANETPLVLPHAHSDTFIGLTAQGLLRSVGADHQVLTDPSLLARLPLRGVNAMVLSEEDVNFDEDSVIAATDQVPIVVLTRAERGATIWHRGERIDVPGFVANVVDPTGAGDVFATAFFLTLRSGTDPITAARHAHAAASCVIEGPGVETLPTQRAVMERLARG